MNADDAKRHFFDNLADRWDTLGDLQATRRALGEVLDGLALRPEERILDLGSGTGVLTEALLDHLSEEGRITAVDLSREMIRVARRKVSDLRVDWLVAEASHLPVADGAIDRAFCFSSWPHFHDPDAAADELFRVLRPGGFLHILHLVPRARVNEIHTTEGGAIGNDLLLPGGELASLLARHGFAAFAVIDTSERYLLSAARESLPENSSA